MACVVESVAVAEPGSAAEGAAAAAPAEIVITAPLPGADLSIGEVPANVQRIDANELDAGRSRGVGDALDQLAGSVTVNDTQANPFQPDVNFRGFTGSPILGTPQGVSVYVDGVRVNEAFGDEVNWDLIPQSAISNLELIPGSNPMFGLNTLGGAVAVTTKRGLDFPGASLGFEAGSFGRRALDADAGGHGGAFDYFLAGQLYDDDGWADHNPSRVRHGFAKLGYREGATDATLSATWADNRFEGNQALPRSFLSNPWQAYTWPDTQQNRMGFVDLAIRHSLGEDWIALGQVHFRQVNTAVNNSNVNDEYDPALPVGAGNQPTGNVIEQIDQRQPGAGLQFVDRSTVAAHRNALTVGASYDYGSTGFWQYQQEAGSSRDTSSSAPRVLTTQLRATSGALGVYAADTLELTPGLFLNLAGRYNDARVSLDDRLGTALDGDHRFDRFNPALGLSFSPSASVTLYGRYEEGMRAPTPVELTCADPNAPCSLPNAFASDPPLQAVIARTVEAGGRATLNPQLSLTAALFRTTLDDDIQFVSSGGGSVSSGYFRNVGQTRRQGLELGLAARAGHYALDVHYTYMDASYGNSLVLNSPDNSTAAPITCPRCTEIQVMPGDRIPGIPRQVAKLRAAYESLRWQAGLTVMAQSNQYARGDENNQDANGALPGYAIVNLDARHELAPRWSGYARIDNLFNRRYSSFATLGRNVFTAPGGSFDASGTSWRSEQFRSVGAPFGAWIGMTYRIGAPAAADAPTASPPAPARN